MNTKFGLKFASKLNHGEKKSQVFKSSYGTWTVNVVSAGYHAFCGIIILNPTFDENSIDQKDIKITVERRCSSYSSLNQTVIAEPLEKLVFCFGPFPSTGTSGYSCEIIVKIEMPHGIDDTIVEQKGIKAHCKNLFETGNSADITIKSENKIINVHKNILMRSEVFEKMLTNDMEEAKSSIVIIKDIKHEVIVEMCRFLYYDEIPKIQTHALDLLVAANKYMIQDLATRCEKFLKRNITTKNVLNILVTADKLDKEKLRDAAITYIIANCTTIFPSKNWLDLKKTNMPLAMLVMEKNMMSNAGQK